MSKLDIAVKLADEAGTSVDEAMKFVDDIGGDTARNLADDLASKGGDTVRGWAKPAAAVGVVGSGGALAWRQQDVEQAKQIAKQQQSRSAAVKSIMQSDLPPKVKRQLVEQLINTPPGGSGDDKGSGLPGLGDIFGNMSGIQTTIGLVVVLAILIQFGGGE